MVVVQNISIPLHLYSPGVYIWSQGVNTVPCGSTKLGKTPALPGPQVSTVYYPKNYNNLYFFDLKIVYFKVMKDLIWRGRHGVVG